MSLTVSHRPESAQFVALIDDREAGHIDYETRHGEIAMLHTIVDPTFEGQGVGSALAREAFATASRQGWGVLPYCSFLQAYVRRHAECLDLVPADRRDEFSLVDV